MKNSKIKYGIFIAIVFIIVICGIYYIIKNLNDESYVFNGDGYILKLEDNKASAYRFNNGVEYNYKRFNDQVTFKSDKGNVDVNENSIAHYADNSFLTLNKMVGIDLSNIDTEIILYYNIFKNTKINKNGSGYQISTQNNENINFNDLLLRLDENKYFIAGEQVKLLLNDDEVVDLNGYAYIEYDDGSIVNLYNQDKYYHTISNKAKIVSGNVSIDLANKIVSKENVNYISLTNLVMNNDSNIDVLTVSSDGKSLGLVESNPSSIDPNEGGEKTDINIVDDDGGHDADDGDEEVVDESLESNSPIFKVTELKLTPIEINAKIEILDDDLLITSPTNVSIIENSTLDIVYQSEEPLHNSVIQISSAALKPDTEYTLIASAVYVKKDVEYEKNFISKIFRTESLGVDFEKSYASTDTIAVNVTKEIYSKVTSATLGIFDNGNLVEYKTVVLNTFGDHEVVFDDLNPNTKYELRLYNILCQGVVVDDGIVMSKEIYSLKRMPTIDKVSYELDKTTGSFVLIPGRISDLDNGITSYRYEIFDARQDMNTDAPTAVYTTNNNSSVVVKIDDNKILRGVEYTYRLIGVFNDNEKIIEYDLKDFNETMQLDGVQFPSLEFVESSEIGVTWEQINGVIKITDDDNAIVGDKFKVVYKNSIDMYDEFVVDVDTRTNTIPINVNGLRANETYTFQVFGTINLQDGNPTVNDTYIGSVYVKTKKPKDLAATYVLNDDHVNSFSFNFRLNNVLGQNATLEASTLSEITFKLYEGSTVSGNEASKMRILDLNSEPYVSTIKENYYDMAYTITPEFFNMKNSDFTSKSYTMEVGLAYDYTKYKNEIKIINNVYTFNVNAALPELPEDPNNNVRITPILNKNAVAFNIEHDDNLDPNTIVGYNMVANYRNESKYDGYILYHVHVYDPANRTFEKIEALDREVPFNLDGSLQTVTYSVLGGTELIKADTDYMRRGNRYYISYEVYLDIDGDGNTDTEYPKALNPDLVLRSTELAPKKQTSKFYMYPSSSEATTATWKYRYEDVDHAISIKKLFSYAGSSLTASSSPALESGEEYTPITFTGLKANDVYSIKKAEKLLKSDADTYEILNTQYFYGKSNALDISYSVSVLPNKLEVLIDNYYDKETEVAKILSGNVRIVPLDSSVLDTYGVKEFNNVKFKDGSITIDFYDIKDYINTDIKVELSVNYDSGESGFDVNSSFKAMQKMGLSSDNNYYVLSGSLSQTSSIIGSRFATTFDPINNRLKLINEKNNALTIGFTIDNKGVLYNTNYITLKAIRTVEINSKNNLVKFNTIIPGISVRNSNGKLNITSLLTGAEIKARIINESSSNIVNNKIYMELYVTDENGANASKVGDDIAYNVSDFDNPIVLSDLLPKSNYYVKFYTYLEGNDEKLYLYDIDDHFSGSVYRFYTLSDVGIDNIKLKLTSNSYNDRILELSYTIDNASIDHIEYKIYKWNGSKFVDSGINIENTPVANLNHNMSIIIDAKPGNPYGIAWGQKYRVVITPVGDYVSDGKTKEMELGAKQKDITLPVVEDSYLGLSSSKTENSFTFRVSSKDPDHVFTNDKYSVKLIDSEYNVIYSADNISSTTASVTFPFDGETYGLVEGKKYTFIVTAYLDKNNSGDNFIEYTKSKSITYGDSTFLGTISTSNAFSGAGNIDVIFNESYKINRITNVSYTISLAKTGEYVYAKDDEFNVIYNSASDIYYYSINMNGVTGFKENEMYLITMNFFEGSLLVAQEEVNYYYGGNE